MHPSASDRSTTRELADCMADWSASITPAQLRTIEQLTASLVQQGLARDALQPGQVAPDFILSDCGGQAVRLYDLLQQGPVVIVFFRGGWCGFCQTYLRGLQRATPLLRAAGAELVAVSPQLPDPSLALEIREHLAFRVLCDVGLKVSTRFGLSYPLPAAVQKVYREFGADLPTVNGPAGADRLPLAATYLIAPDRIIHTAAIDENPAQRLDPADILSALRTLRSK